MSENHIQRVDKMFREVGIEREYFLLKQKETEHIWERIVEPVECQLPADIFGFLMELRSEPWEHLNTVKDTWDDTYSYHERRADKIFKCDLVDIPYMVVPEEVGKYFYDKYHGEKYTDFTRNVYDIEKTHHLGMFFDYTPSGRCLLTAGTHVHFSLRDDNGHIVTFKDKQVDYIVRAMDDIYEERIINAKRIIGEWEPKMHGFEYRSIPCNVPVYRILKDAFRVLREVTI